MKFEVYNNYNLLVLKDATDDELFTLEKVFNRTVEGWHYKKKHLKNKSSWNGVVEMFKKSRYLPLGLYGELKKTCEKFNYPLELINLHDVYDTEIKFDEFNAFITDFFVGNKYQPYPYQIKTAYEILKHKKCLGELATSAGKTLILFMTIAYQIKQNPNNKILIVVPNIGLVEQTSSDLCEYDCDDKLSLKIQNIYSGQKSIDQSNVVVGTYQSLVNKKRAYFTQFNACIVDEVHQAQSTSVRRVLQNCLHCSYRYGVSGTIQSKDEQMIERWNVMAYTGPIISEVTAKYLMDEGYIATAEIKILRLVHSYSGVFAKNLYDLSKKKETEKLLSFEIDYVQNSESRLNFVTDLIVKSKKTTLVLFQERMYGKQLFDSIKSKTTDHFVYYVDGNTPVETREFYKTQAENNTNVIIVASYGTFSTGINIRNLHYIFLTESFKSDRIIRQSIGRGLRLHHSKSKVYIIDIVDDLSYFKNGKRIWANYLVRHGLERINIYKEQSFQYQIKSFSI